ncbi:hypothetical protein Sked_27480 [Sanguibacter keddieii DSM 10542]|uniref:Uncharacterized protein n=1 Tax=Sanguibacter keddieii (strain ATCC 51767 / DSM 10542 / NCFB 3025 / ST-74) TaxID=446469 RepID=D1BAU9_SANKS|nr:PPA1309 family protein [Sanguibacter keddieii]ACZ22650.1 hypothetical protein Sked_27480 [Sanguibacter keddieii DSM 10542]
MTEPAPRPADPTSPSTSPVDTDTAAPEQRTAQPSAAGGQAPSMAEIFLAQAVTEVESHVATTGWDAPLRVFALVSTQAALEAEPALADALPTEAVDAARDNPLHLTSVEQDGVPESIQLDDLLASITWPEAVAGAALVVERIILPPSAEEGVPEDPSAALAYLAEHPDRQDVRMAVGVLRDGTSWCALRTRTNDTASDVAGGPALVPGLVDALRATFD